MFKKSEKYSVSGPAPFKIKTILDHENVLNNSYLNKASVFFI